MSDSGTTTNKPPANDPASSPGAVTQFGSRRRSPDSAPALFSAQLDRQTRDLLQALKETIAQLPELDSTRVVQLHQRIVADEYEVDAERLAEKLLDLESSLDK